MFVGSSSSSRPTNALSKCPQVPIATESVSNKILQALQQEYTFNTANDIGENPNGSKGRREFSGFKARWNENGKKMIRITSKIILNNDQIHCNQHQL